MPGGPLDGFLVVDVSERSASAAIAGMLLADYGAHVVRVEPSGGDPIRALNGSAVWLRGQESVTEGADGLSEDELLALCRSADVVIDTAQSWTDKQFSYRPPVPAHQVYCLLTAEPARAEDIARGVRPAEPVYGELAEARYGLMYVQDGIREAPIFIGVPHAIMGAAWLIALGSLGALYGRERTGRGQVVTASLADALAILNNWRWVGGGDPPLQPWPDHSSFNRFGNSRMILAMLECSDGWIQLNTGAKGAGNRFFKLLDRDDLVDPQTDLNPMHVFPSQEVADEFWEFLTREFKRRTVQEWWEDLKAIDVSAMPVLAPGESYALEQAVAQGFSYRRGDTVEYGLSGRLDRSPGAVGAPPVAPGTNNPEFRGQAVRSPVSTGDSDAPSPPRSRGPLEDLLVLDLGVFIAGPFSMRLLGDMGARVLRIEDPALVGQDIPGHSMSYNRGKDGITLQLKSPEAKQIVRDLVQRADVFDHNQRFGVMDRLGLGHEELRELNPRLVYCHASGYGNLGPWATLPVFGPMPDALSGAFVRTGGAGNPPMHTVSHVDFGAGLNSAFVVLAALLERERSGKGQFLETPQLGASMLWMSDCYMADGETVQTFALDAQQRGHAPSNALYPTEDGWLVLACYSEREWAAAHAALGVEQREPWAQARARMLDASDDAAGLAKALASRSTAGALELLTSAGVACVEPQVVITEMLLDTELERVGPLVRYDHPVKGEVYDIGRPLRFSEAPVDPPRWPPVPGEHSRRVLIEMGVSPSEVDQLIEAGIVAEADVVPRESRG